MDLLPQKMHEFILTKRYLVHVGGDVTDLALSPYLVEIHRENTRQLLHLLIIWRDVGVQNLRYFALEKVGVANENAAEFQIDDQR